MDERENDGREEVERKLALVSRLLQQSWDDLTRERFAALETELADLLKSVDRSDALDNQHGR